MRTTRAVRFKIGGEMCSECLNAIKRADESSEPRDFADCLACRAHLEVRDGGWEFVSRNPRAE